MSGTSGGFYLKGHYVEIPTQDSSVYNMDEVIIPIQKCLFFPETE